MNKMEQLIYNTKKVFIVKALFLFAFSFVLHIPGFSQVVLDFPLGSNTSMNDLQEITLAPGFYSNGYELTATVNASGTAYGDDETNPILVPSFSTWMVRMLPA